MLELNTQSSSPSRRLSMGMARYLSEVEEAQRLRYKVFSEEMGARLPSAEEGLDRDLYDRHCEHLLVRDGDNHKVVGTYRILSPSRAHALGSYYSETEFDLDRLSNLRSQMVEVGRSCVHPAYRDGATITQLWGGLADYMVRNKYQYLIGCASIGMGDGGHYAASVFQRIYQRHAAPSEYRVFPHCPLPLAALNQSLEVNIPPLLKGYLRLGAYIGGEPAWDPDFNTADVFILLPLSRMNPRYAKHFIR
ncbi:carrier protein N-acyltransferase [Ferriphaselus amnicola]|uniref:L-ornithine N(alpha)-acyltransferase n=1 Tax=Ferriphaselus amnicola TaxID=1188319 RepID=A0A2Z6GD69_9PROT|nr:GNAT family N-acyltransferase [Ferriphaselus amnicola]BBE51551.1 carrier protein N-acyltransferase [Ferriphaselus amnicola]